MTVVTVSNRLQDEIMLYWATISIKEIAGLKVMVENYINIA